MGILRFFLKYDRLYRNEQRGETYDASVGTTVCEGSRTYGEGRSAEGNRKSDGIRRCHQQPFFMSVQIYRRIARTQRFHHGRCNQ